MEKLYDKIIWHNNNEPAINEDNLNAMSEAIDGLDDRVIAIGNDVFVKLPQIQAYLDQAEDLVEAMETMTKNPPYIGENGHWYTWDTDTNAYVDSGIDASISVDIADITMLPNGSTPYVTNSGTDTDPVFHLFIPIGDPGRGISSITKTSTVGLVDTYTITYSDGTTSTFNVTNGRDGSGAGDMTAAVYDPNGDVATAGGIPDYIPTAAMTRNGSNAGNVTFDGTFTVGGRAAGSSGIYSMSQGYSNVASGRYSFAAGFLNTASGDNATVSGQSNTVAGDNSNASGLGLSVAYANQTAVGKYNDNKATTLFEVGGGTNNDSRNVFEVYDDGKISTDNGATKHDLNTVASNASAGAAAAGTWSSAVSQAVGDTTCTITNAAITTSSILDPYCETSSGKPVSIKQITVTTGQAVLTFDALTEAATFKLWIR